LPGKQAGAGSGDKAELNAEEYAAKLLGVSWQQIEKAVQEAAKVVRRTAEPNIGPMRSLTSTQERFDE
jgi:hypothetical protein